MPASTKPPDVAAMLQGKRCVNCDLTKKIDLAEPPRKGWIRSVCGVCGKWLGDRQVSSKSE